MLNSQGGESLLIGRYAVSDHGYARRATKDVFARVSPQNAERLADVPYKFGGEDCEVVKVFLLTGPREEPEEWAW